MSLYFLPKSNKKFPSLLYDQLTKFNDLINPTDMMQKLTNMLQLTDEDYKERETVCSGIHEIVKKYYPNCLLVMFGSSINGFGVKNSDLDLLFLPYPEYSCNPEKPKTEDITPPPDPDSILSGETPRDTLYKLQDWSHIKFLKLVLKKDKTLVKKAFIMPLTAGNTPTLKVRLANTKMSCDIHIANKIVLFNSELLQFLEKVDPRIKPLVITLSFWGKSIGFARRTIFSNYVFTLLVIFYLQNTSPPILPPIQHLMDRADFRRMASGWQTAFSTDMRIIKKTNTQSLGELLVNFFEFYFNFDFVQHIVSPNAGKVLPVKAMEMSKFKDFEISAVNVQDPFILNRNVSKLESDTPIVLFKLALHIAHQMLKSVPEKYKFSMFFDPNAYQRVLDTYFTKYMVGRPKVCLINLDYDSMCFLNKNWEYSPELWYEMVAQVVYEVLQYGLLMECEVTDKMNWGKKVAPLKASNRRSKAPAKNGSPEDSSPFNLELIQSIQCVVYSRTWMGRKKLVKAGHTPEDIEDFNSSALKTEHSLSKELIQSNPVLNSQIPLMCFRCDCYKHTCPKINNVVVLFKPLTLSREFYQFSAFLSSYLPKTVKKILSLKSP